VSAADREGPLDADRRDAGPDGAPGQLPIILAGLSVGVLLMGVQLWLLTVALDLYLAGAGGQIWLLALVSGLIFAGGLLVLWVLRRRPRWAGR
jgi:hypothetical protein